MKYVLCPPCGTVFEAPTEDEVIRTAQEHAKEKHAYDLSRKEILNAMTREPSIDACRNGVDSDDKQTPGAGS